MLSGAVAVDQFAAEHSAEPFAVEQLVSLMAGVSAVVSEELTAVLCGAAGEPVAEQTAEGPVVQ